VEKKKGTKSLISLIKKLRRGRYGDMGNAKLLEEKEESLGKQRLEEFLNSKVHKHTMGKEERLG